MDQEVPSATHQSLRANGVVFTPTPGGEGRFYLQRCPQTSGDPTMIQLRDLDSIGHHLSGVRPFLERFGTGLVVAPSSLGRSYIALFPTLSVLMGESPLQCYCILLVGSLPH